MYFSVMVHFGYRFSCLVSLQPETDARQASLRTTTDWKKKSRNSCELRHLRRNKKIPQLGKVAGFEMVERVTLFQDRMELEIKAGGLKALKEQVENESKN